MPVFEWRSPMPAPADDVYAWHARRGAFERLVPSWQRVSVVERTGGIGDGAVLVLQYHEGPLRGRWVAVHQDNIPGHQFVDRQVHGPFAYWEHTHSFIPQTETTSVLEDHVEYGLPLGGLADVLGGGPSGHALERMFRFRHTRARHDLQRHADTAKAKRLRVGVTGATGLVGRQLCAFLTAGGHEVVRIVRGARIEDGDIVWDPAIGKLSAASLEGLDAIINLAGESTNGRWTAARKHRIMASRREGARLLAETLAGMKKPPKTVVSMSAVGFYGARGEDLLDEDGGPGDGFLSEVVQAWEDAWEPARAAGLRVVTLRSGVVLTPAGGALARMLPAYRAGVGGRMGGGGQWFAWIAPDDLLGAVLAALTDKKLAGPVNVVGPEQVTNREFVEVLGRVLRRPTIVPLPAFAISHGFGQMGEEMLLGGQRVRPAKLEERGFRFDFPRLEEVLRFELGRN